MLLESPWKPRLAATSASPSERLVTALADDILEGGLVTGSRLPPHRDLAYRLDIGLGTVTKAYAILERRGLVRSDHGRGTFVAFRQAEGDVTIDLSVNTPPPMLSEALLARTLVGISKRIDPGRFTSYPPAGGHDEYRRQMASWLKELGMETEADRLILCNGAQQALWIAFSVICDHRTTILTEARTYPGAIDLACHAGYRLCPVEMDEQGLRPDALDHAVRNFRSSAVLYVTPTIQNPTTATMGLARRHEIVRLCRLYDITIVEDDVYSLCAMPELPPLAMLAPERTLYANSLSKSLSPGLRIGALVVPPAYVKRAEAGWKAAGLMVSPLSCAIMEQWLTDGTAASVRASIKAEASRRLTLAKSLIGTAMIHGTHDGFHAWLPLNRVDAERLGAAAAAVGVLVTPPGATAVDPEAEQSGVRLCLGAPSLLDLKTALTNIARILGHLRGERPRGSGSV